MRTLPQICAEAGGAVPATPGILTFHLSSGLETIRLTRTPTAAECVALEFDLSADFLGLSTYSTALDAAELLVRVADGQWGFTQVVSTIPISIMPMSSPATVVVCDVDPACLASFLNEVGTAGAAAGIDDLQMVLGATRGGAREDLETLSGVVLDIDTSVADPCTHHLLHQAPTPNVVYSTERVGGARILYLFDRAYALTSAVLEKRRDLVEQLALAYPGVDPRCGDVTQRQHLPTTSRTIKGPRRLVKRTAVQLSTDPILLEKVTPGLPSFVLEALSLGGGAVSDDERCEIEAYLDGRGIPAPPVGARSPLYSRCPLKQHNTGKTYVNRHADGRITVHCLGGHAGAGPQHWTEQNLLELAREVPS